MRLRKVVYRQTIDAVSQCRELAAAIRWTAFRFAVRDFSHTVRNWSGGSVVVFCCARKNGRAVFPLLCKVRRNVIFGIITTFSVLAFGLPDAELRCVCPMIQPSCGRCRYVCMAIIVIDFRFFLVRQILFAKFALPTFP